MTGHDNLGSERVDRIQGAQPVEAVAVVDEQELVGKVELAQIDNAILRHEDDAVASRVRPADVENLNLLAAVIQRHAIPERLLRQARGLFLGWHLLPLHQREQIGAVVFVADLEHIPNESTERRSELQ